MLTKLRGQSIMQVLFRHQNSRNRFSLLNPQLRNIETEQRRTFSQMVSKLLHPKYFQAYRALVLPQLKKVGLGEPEADLIIAKAKEGVEADRKDENTFESHVLAAHLALSTNEVVSQAKGNQTDGQNVALETLLSSQIFETSTHKVATMLSWNKRKHAAKVAQDFCKDQSKALDAKFDEDQCAVTVNKCFYVDFFNKNDQPDLAKIFCKAEKALFESASAPSSGLTFEMKQTIADGATACNLQFVKTNK